MTENYLKFMNIIIIKVKLPNIYIMKGKPLKIEVMAEKFPKLSTMVEKLLNVVSTKGETTGDYYYDSETHGD